MRHFPLSIHWLISVLLIAITGSGLPGSSFAVDPDCSDYDESPPIPVPVQTIYGAYLEGELLYFAGKDPWFGVLSIEDIQNPRLLSAVPGGSMSSGGTMIKRGNHVLVRSMTGIEVFDVGDPMAVLHAKHFSIPVTRLIDSGSHVYSGYTNSVSSEVFTFEVLDVEDPLQVVRIGSLDLRRKTLSPHLDGDGDLAVVTGERLTVIDAAVKTDPRAAGETPRPYGLVAMEGDWVYALASPDTLQTIEITDSLQPEIRGTLLIPSHGNPSAMILEGDRLYLTESDCGFHVFDTSDPATPVYLYYRSFPFAGVVEPPIAVSSMYILGDRALTFSHDLETPEDEVIFDLGSSASTLISPLPIRGSAHDLHTVGDLVYLADGYHGLETFDFSDPMQPRYLGHVDTPFHAQSVDVVGNLAYVADQEGGLRIVDVSDPGAPVEIGRDSEGVFVWDAVGYGDHVYVSRREYGLHVVDVSDPSAPRTITNLAGFAWSLALRGELLYVGGMGRIVIHDISEPSYPRQLNAIATAGVIRAFALDGQYMAALDNTAGLGLYDLSDPTAPVLLGEDLQYADATDLDMLDGLLYITDGPRGVHVVEASPSLPQLGHAAPTIDGDFRSIDVSDHGIRAAVYADAVYSLRSFCRTSTPVLLQGFEAEQTGASVRLRWRVSGSGNPTRFLLHRTDSRGRVLALHEGPYDGQALEFVDQDVEADTAYRYQLSMQETGGFEEFLGEVEIRTSAWVIPSRVDAYPNPFQERTRIRWSAGRSVGEVVEIYNTAGRLVRRLEGTRVSESIREAHWDGRDAQGGSVARGFYFLRVRSERPVSTKILYLR